MKYFARESLFSLEWLCSYFICRQYFITASKYARIGGHYIVNVQINEADGPVTIKAWIDVQNNYRSPPRSYGEVEAIFKQREYLLKLTQRHYGLKRFKKMDILYTWLRLVWFIKIAPYVSSRSNAIL